MEPELTIGIATCGRPRILNRCIKSIKRYTNIPYKLIVLDNIKAFTDNPNARAVRLPKGTDYLEISNNKIGCCESNNLIADACNTQYLMHMDDDVVLHDDGIIENMLKEVKLREDTYVVGGTWFDTYYNTFRHQTMQYIFGSIKNRAYVRKFPIPYQFTNNLNLDYVLTHECLHSMIMDKEKVYSKVKWDNHFKWKGDRLDFFMQCADKNIKLATYCKQNFIHDPKPFEFGTLSYEDFGGKEAIEYFTKKWKIFPIVGWDKRQEKPR